MPLWVYILTNRSGTLYTGVTNNVARRLAEHRSDSAAGFTGQYAIDRLVYVEEHARPADAIAREKQIKGWRREKKVDLINASNPEWRDLAQSGEA